MALYIFENIRKVMEAENLCRSLGIEYAVKTIPSHISNECGMALVVDNELFELELKGRNIEFTVVINSL